MSGPGMAAEATGVGIAVGVAGVAGAADATGAGDGFVGATFTGIGWIDTYRPSQTIGFGSYFQGVKKRFNWAGVSFVFGAMS
jgi:hypothetical protein